MHFRRTGVPHASANQYLSVFGVPHTVVNLTRESITLGTPPMASLQIIPPLTPYVAKGENSLVYPILVSNQGLQDIKHINGSTYPPYYASSQFLDPTCCQCLVIVNDANTSYVNMSCVTVFA